MLPRARWSLLPAAVSLLAACGTVIVNPGGTTAGTGGAGSASTAGTGSTGGAATGGKGGTGGAATGGTGGAGGAATATVCGGPQGILCAADDLCQWDLPGSCGDNEGTGTCQKRPAGACPPDCPGVCGCDGLPYCNACSANAAGLDVSGHINCGPDAAYEANVVPTLDGRYVITKAEHTSNRCVAVFVVSLETGAWGVDVTGTWSVESVWVSPHADDCAHHPGDLWDPPDLVVADAATGTIVHDKDGWPCSLNVSVVATWPPGSPAWVPAEDTLMTTHLELQGAVCPP